jgi:hypothetical protein
VNRTCVDCGTPAEWALLDEDAASEGYVCIACASKRRRDPAGWRERAVDWMHRKFGI